MCDLGGQTTRVAGGHERARRQVRLPRGYTFHYFFTGLLLSYWGSQRRRRLRSQVAPLRMAEPCGRILSMPFEVGGAVGRRGRANTLLSDDGRSAMFGISQPEKGACRAHDWASQNATCGR